MSTRTHTTLIEYAASRGSKANSREGARRYLLSHQPPPIPGLMRLSTGDYAPPTPRRDPRPSDCQSVSHVERADRLATSLASQLAASPAPFSAAHERTAGLTADMAARIDAKLAALIEQKAATTIAHAWPFRRARSRWVGGSHVVRVKVSDAPNCSCESTVVWARNRHWLGRDSIANLACTRRALEFLGPGLTFHGMLCLDVEPFGSRTFRVTYVAQGRGFGVTLRVGWIVRGFFSDAEIQSAAQRREEQLRKKLASRLRAARHSSASNLKSIRVTEADSVKARNCSEGRERFRLQHPGLTRRGSVRADLLLAVNASEEAHAAIQAAQQRTAQAQP